MDFSGPEFREDIFVSFDSHQFSEFTPGSWEIFCGIQDRTRIDRTPALLSKLLGEDHRAGVRGLGADVMSYRESCQRSNEAKVGVVRLAAAE